MFLSTLTALIHQGARNWHAGSRRADDPGGSADAAASPGIGYYWCRCGGGLAPYDSSGMTALVAATMLFELICLVAERRAANP